MDATESGKEQVLAESNIHRLAPALLIILALAGCSGTPTPYPAEVDWETAVEILNTGKVEMVVQAHSLDVSLTMEDGSVIHTVEPQIDAIFTEIQKCGEPCSQIVQATE